MLFVVVQSKTQEISFPLTFVFTYKMENPGKNLNKKKDSKYLFGFWHKLADYVSFLVRRYEKKNNTFNSRFKELWNPGQTFLRLFVLVRRNKTQESTFPSTSVCRYKEENPAKDCLKVSLHFVLVEMSKKQLFCFKVKEFQNPEKARKKEKMYIFFSFPDGPNVPF